MSCEPKIEGGALPIAESPAYTELNVVVNGIKTIAADILFVEPY